MKKSQIIVAAWYRRYAVRPFDELPIESHAKQQKWFDNDSLSVVNVLNDLFHLTATKEIPEDQECHHCGAVLHQRMAGGHPTIV